MAQEVLNNVQCHAQATTVTVGLAVTPQRAVLTVADNGAGFDVDTVTPNRYGLMGINERVRLLHGSLQIERAPGKGTRVEAGIALDGASLDRRGVA